MYWEPTFYSVLHTAEGLGVASAVLYLLGWYALAGDGPVRHLRRLRTLRAPLREASIIAGLYCLWGLIGIYNLANYAGARQRGEDIWDIERRLHLPAEDWVQQPAVHHPLFGKVLNQYYLFGHVNAVMILLLWLWFRHRDKYARGRVVLIMFTLVSVVMQWVPVAPPRFLTLHRVVDVGRLYDQTIYHSISSGSADQLAAMPSVHEGWAILVAAVAVRSTTSRWRHLVWLHPIAMMYVVVATGNHYWADGIVAGAVLILVFAALRLWDLALARWWDQEPLLVPVEDAQVAPAPGVTASGRG